VRIDPAWSGSRRQKCAGANFLPFPRIRRILALAGLASIVSRK